MKNSKLRGKIVEKFGTLENFAKELGTTRQTLSNKMNKKIPWKQDQIETVCMILDIDKSQIFEYFFSE